jgi:uncharacterized membrane protein YdfJ with MMPL/SSD domain
VAGSVTVLPALLSLLGDRVEFGRVPFLGRISRPASGSRFWKFVLDRVLARPGLSATVAAGALLALAAPALTIHTARLTVPQMLPASTPIVQRYDHIMTAFPGGPVPAMVVVQAPDIKSAAAQRQIAALTSCPGGSPGSPHGPFCHHPHSRTGRYPVSGARSKPLRPDGGHAPRGRFASRP